MESFILTGRCQDICLNFLLHADKHYWGYILSMRGWMVVVFRCGNEVQTNHWLEASIAASDIIKCDTLKVEKSRSIFLSLNSIHLLWRDNLEIWHCKHTNRYRHGDCSHTCGTWISNHGSTGLHAHWSHLTLTTQIESSQGWAPWVEALHHQKKRTCFTHNGFTNTDSQIHFTFDDSRTHLKWETGYLYLLYLDGGSFGHCWIVGYASYCEAIESKKL